MSGIKGPPGPLPPEALFFLPPLTITSAIAYIPSRYGNTLPLPRGPTLHLPDRGDLPHAQQARPRALHRGADAVADLEPDLPHGAAVHQPRRAGPGRHVIRDGPCTQPGRIAAAGAPQAGAGAAGAFRLAGVYASRGRGARRRSVLAAATPGDAGSD